MELLTQVNKEHDEHRQGEAYAANATNAVFTKHFYVESYGCAMNFADSEVVASILEKNGYEILETNWTFQKAEVDIIALKGKVLAVVEVPTPFTELTPITTAVISAAGNPAKLI